ncbi:MAG TPA: TonB-dependent receptor [Allosphingosinicella sp.]|jgi:iron complex outermembrane receptor protein|nr:TonB-dependent receptor [Allosphingosinicella sp.]
MTRIALLTTLSSLAFASGPAFAQDNPDSENPDGSTDVTASREAPAGDEETIVVTGTRSLGRTVENSPVPVDVLSAEAITEGGQVETNKILNKLVPSFNFPQPAISDGSDALRPATLRGLSPDQTLVLVNGKRRHVSALLNINGTVGRGAAAVDMNSIPALAIDRIEVLRDGASSQYGSDAIAGVINIRLKTTSDGGRAVASFGKYVTTLNDVQRVTGLQTVNGQPMFDPTNNIYLLANTDGELKVRDGETYTLASNFGIPLFGVDGGYVNLTLEYRQRNRTNRTGFDLRPNYVRPTATTFDPRELTFDRREFRFGDPDAKDYSVFLNAGLPIGGAELYAFGSFNQRDSLSAANYRQQSNANNVDYSQLAPNQAPPAINRPVLTPDGFLPLIGSDLTDMAATAGVRFDVAKWRADLSLGYGQNQFDYTVSNTVNASFGSATQRRFDAGGLKYSQTLLNLDLSREFELGFAKPLTASFGGEFRRETYDIRPGELQSYALGPFFRAQINNTTLANCTAQQGAFNATTNVCTFPGRQGGPGAQGFPGLPASAATDAARHNLAGYVELDTDFAEGLTVTAAGRFEHYSDFGNALAGKLAARYEFLPGFAVRGSVSNGFRAPSLHQQVFTTTSTNFISGVPVDVLTAPVSSPLALALGAKPLKAEKSLNIGGGITANPLRGLTLTVDYYNIKIKDRIVLTENLGATTSAADAAIRNYLLSQGLPATAARFFINGLDSRTQGIDAVVNWRLPVDFGRFSLTAAYNYNKNSILSRNNTLGPLASIPGIVLFGRQESLRFTRGQPRDKIVFSLDGDIKPFGLTLRTTRFGKVLSPGATLPLAPNQTSFTALGPDDVELSPKWITDIELRFDLGSRLHLAVGADNVLDVYPDRLPFGARPAALGGGNFPQNQQYNGYSIFSPFGFNGRFLYGRVGIDF